MSDSSVWDIIVLSTLDHSQKVVFETLISGLNSTYAHEFRVIADPDIGVKVGSGGSCLYVIDALYKEFEEKLFQKRILFLVVGGYSKRQATGSVLGKLSILVPMDVPEPTTIFQLKLEICSKFLPFLPPGLFLSSSDTLEYYDEETIASLHDDSFFDPSGFTLLAYRNPLETALNHGVYVLEDEISQDFSHAGIVEKRKIKKILQKPGIELVKSENAWYFDSDTKHEYVYTDSVYFMANDVIKVLLALVRSENFRVETEICAYGDFLRPLGPENEPDYAKSPTQLQLYHILRPFPVKALTLKSAKFYHMGTFHEYLYHYCNDLLFAQHFNLAKVCNVKFVEFQNQKPYTKTSVKGCLMSSILASDSTIPQTCIVEHCRFEKGLEIRKSNTILSNCTSDQPVIIDQAVFMMTVSMMDGDWPGSVPYVTFVFETFTDFKRIFQENEPMLYFGLPLTQAVQYWKNLAEDQKVNIFGTQPKTFWHAKIFPTFSTMSESFDESLEFFNWCQHFAEKNEPVATGSQQKKFAFKNRQCYSLHDAMKNKNVDDMMKFRGDLYSKININTL